MEIQVLIDPIANNRYRACGGPPFPFIAEGDTPHEAIQNLRQLIQERLKAGAAICRIKVPMHENPLIQWAGSSKPDDPLYEEWRQAVEEYRRQCDEDREWEELTTAEFLKGYAEEDAIYDELFSRPSQGPHNPNTEQLRSDHERRQ